MVTGDAAFQSGVLEEVAGAVHYHAWLVSLVEPQLGDNPLEVGSGTGDYAASLAARGQSVTVSEAYGPSLHRLQERFADDERVVNWLSQKMSRATTRRSLPSTSSSTSPTMRRRSDQWRAWLGRVAVSCSSFQPSLFL